MDNLTTIEESVLARMNHGCFLIKDTKGEYISNNGTNFGGAVKAGTVGSLLEKGLIEKSPLFKTRHLLTTEGRKYRNFK